MKELISQVLEDLEEMELSGQDVFRATRTSEAGACYLKYDKGDVMIHFTTKQSLVG